MFVIAYHPSGDPVSVQSDATGLKINGGDWIVDTENDGQLATIEDLEVALDRVKNIRLKGGEACLLAVLE